mmetsp:Transcript_669/g.1252  ORF Transcript_669/g.1252 Transcript_669/m.1252 type:complete len:168 (-) Transcript_669:44-547(-)
MECPRMVSFRLSHLDARAKKIVGKINNVIRQLEDTKIYGGITRGKPVATVEICINPVLVKLFLKKQTEFRAKGIPCKATFAFHGTATKNISSIVTTNLDPARVGEKLQEQRILWGRGVLWNKACAGKPSNVHYGSRPRGKKSQGALQNRRASEERVSKPLWRWASGP